MVVAVLVLFVVATHALHIPLVRYGDDLALLRRLKAHQQRWGASFLETGEVPLDVEILSSKHLATYYGYIEVDDTRFKVLFDTGSAEFWIPSMSCQTPRCAKHARLPIRKDRRIATAAGLHIQYLSGKVTGDMIYDTVKLGDVTVENQVIGLGRVVDIDLLDDVRWDGICGLAYPNPTLTAEGVLPIFDTIIKSGVLTKKHLSNQFSYFISDTDGAMTFGGADCSLLKADGTADCIDEFHFVPVTEKTYWTITLKDVRIKYPNQAEKSGFCPSAGCKAIVDTGTYLIYGPDTQVSSMLASSLKSCHKHDEMPTFTFDFQVGDGDPAVSLSLAPIDYILKFHEAEKSDCVVGISPDKDTIWTLGQVFLRSFYTVFDRDEDRVGFARLPRKRLKAVNSKSTLHALKKRRKIEKKEHKIEDAKRAAKKQKDSSLLQELETQEQKRKRRHRRPILKYRHQTRRRKTTTTTTKKE